MPESILALVAGLLIGSFLNVCIFRMPRDLSVVRPRSFCPACEHPIAWYDNIPVVSYFLLRRRCRHCNALIPARYLIVELLTATLFFLIVNALGLTGASARLCLLTALLVGLTFADLEERILPDEFTLAGCLCLGGFLFEKIRHKEGLGLGDVKMMAMFGAFLGLRATLLTLILGSVAGSIIGLIYIRATKQDTGSYELPFGTFLGFAGIFVALVGEKVIRWYVGML